MDPSIPDAAEPSNHADRTATGPTLIDRCRRTKSIERILADADHPQHRLKRTLTAWDLTGLGIGAIIGAGLGGLTAGAMLARGGFRVAVFDGHYVAGGCGTMFSRGAGDRRFLFDIGLHYIGDCQPEGRIPTLLRAAADGCPRPSEATLGAPAL